MNIHEIAKAASLEVTKCDPKEWGGEWMVKICEHGWSAGHESFDSAVKFAVMQNSIDGLSDLIWSALLSYNSEDKHKLENTMSNQSFQDASDGKLPIIDVGGIDSVDAPEYGETTKNY